MFKYVSNILFQEKKTLSQNMYKLSLNEDQRLGPRSLLSDKLLQTIISRVVELFWNKVYFVILINLILKTIYANNLDSFGCTK